MKRKIQFSIWFAAAMSIAVWSASAIYNATLVNDPAIAYTKTYTLNLNKTPNANGIANISAQAVYSTTTAPSSTFTDGKASTGSFTVVSTASLVSAIATDQITMPSTALLTPVSATDYFTIVSTTGLSSQYLAINGAIIQNGSFAKTTSSATALALATYLNAHYANKFVSTVTAGGTIVYSTATAGGSAGNGFTFFSSKSSVISVGGASFAGGRDSALLNAYITVNGVRYSQGRLWHDTGISSTTAVSFRDTVLRYLPGIASSVSGSVIYATATAAGVAANGFTFAASTPAITIASPNFTGGQSAAQICVNAVCLTEGNQWNLGATSTTATTAASIRTAINASSSLSAIVVSTNTVGSAVVFATSTAVGTASNYALSSSTPTAISVSGPTLTAGANSAYQLSSPIIALPSHGLGTAYGVVFSTLSGTALNPLVTGTTYFAIVIDANNAELATTAQNAIAGTFITFTSSSTAGPHSFKLTPQTYSGTAGLQWFGSNDGVNFDALSVSSVTLSSPPAANTATLWDFGRINFKYLSLTVTAPTTGALALTVTVNAP